MYGKKPTKQDHKVFFECSMEIPSDFTTEKLLRTHFCHKKLFKKEKKSKHVKVRYACKISKHS